MTPALVDTLRTVNVFGMGAVTVLFAVMIAQRWSAVEVPRRIMWAGSWMIFASNTYGIWEVQNLSTFYRIPMLTVGWAVVSIGIVGEIVQARRST